MTSDCAIAVTACSTLAHPPTESPWACDDSARVTVTTVGDSILEGAYSDVGAALDANLSDVTYDVRPRARSGSVIGDCVAQYQCASPAVDVVVWNAGINNINQGWTADAAWTEAQALLDAMRANGAKLVVANIGPCAGYATCNNPRNDAYNASLASWCAAQGAGNCALVDYNATFRDPGNPSILKASCREGSDWLHLNAACSDQFAALLADAVETIAP